jgi:hypothetical protein
MPKEAAQCFEECGNFAAAADLYKSFSPEDMAKCYHLAHDYDTGLQALEALNVPREQIRGFLRKAVAVRDREREREREVEREREREKEKEKERREIGWLTSLSFFSVSCATRSGWSRKGSQVPQAWYLLRPRAAASDSEERELHRGSRSGRKWKRRREEEEKQHEEEEEEEERLATSLSVLTLSLW